MPEIVRVELTKEEAYAVAFACKAAMIRLRHGHGDESQKAAHGEVAAAHDKVFAAMTPEFREWDMASHPMGKALMELTTVRLYGP